MEPGSTAARLAEDIHALLNRKECVVHNECGWPEPCLPSPRAEEKDQKLEMHKSRRVTRESVESIVSGDVLKYICGSRDDLAETLGVFFSHSALSDEQLKQQFLRANLRSLDVLRKNLDRGVYPESCFLLGLRAGEKTGLSCSERSEEREREETLKREKLKGKGKGIQEKEIQEKATSAQSTEVVQSAQPVQPTEVVQSTQPTPPTPPTEVVQPTQVTQSIQPATQSVPNTTTTPASVHGPTKHTLPPSEPVAKRQRIDPAHQLENLEKQSRFLLESYSPENYPEVRKERQQLEQSLHFITFFKDGGHDSVSNIGRERQAQILLSRGLSFLEDFRAAVMKMKSMRAFAGQTPRPTREEAVAAADEREEARRAQLRADRRAQRAAEVEASRKAQKAQIQAKSAPITPPHCIPQALMPLTPPTMDPVHRKPSKSGPVGRKPSKSSPSKIKMPDPADLTASGVLPADVLKQICTHLDLQDCLALADTSKGFRKSVNSSICKKVVERIPWASGDLRLFLARVVASRARKMTSGDAAWTRVDDLGEIPRSKLRLVEPIDASGPVDFKPFFDGAFLMPFISQRGSHISLVHLQGNKVFTDFVSIHLKTFEVKEDAITAKKEYKKTDSFTTPRGTKLSGDNIQFLDESDNMVWVKQDDVGLLLKKSRKTVQCIRKSAFIPGMGFGKFLGNGFVGVKKVGPKFYVCYIDVVKRETFCLASFTANGLESHVFKTMDILVYNGMLHVNVLNTIIPFWADLSCMEGSCDDVKAPRALSGVPKSTTAFQLAECSSKTLQQTKKLDHETFRSVCGRYVSASMSRGRVVGDLATGITYCVKDDSQGMLNFVFPFLDDETPAFYRWQRTWGVRFFNTLSAELTARGHFTRFKIEEISGSRSLKKDYKFNHYDPVEEIED
ncbi:hypothetical protein CJU89_4830 [Yarrowia sp. B02]|nr:hypothetical protein CJU89_4830 [Yarrowia sp. B02]